MMFYRSEYSRAFCFTGIDCRQLLSDFVEYSSEKFYGIRRMVVVSQHFVASRKILEACGCYIVYSNCRDVRNLQWAIREYRQNDCESPAAIVF